MKNILDFLNEKIEAITKVKNEYRDEIDASILDENFDRVKDYEEDWQYYSGMLEALLMVKLYIMDGKND